MLFVCSTVESLPAISGAGLDCLVSERPYKGVEGRAYFSSSTLRAEIVLLSVLISSLGTEIGTYFTNSVYLVGSLVVVACSDFCSYVF